MPDITGIEPVETEEALRIVIRQEFGAMAPVAAALVLRPVRDLPAALHPVVYDYTAWCMRIVSANTSWKEHDEAYRRVIDANQQLKDLVIRINALAGDNEEEGVRQIKAEITKTRDELKDLYVGLGG